MSFPFSQNKLIVSKPSQRRRKEEKSEIDKKKVSNFPHSGFQNLRRIVKKIVHDTISQRKWNHIGEQTYRLRDEYICENFSHILPHECREREEKS